MTSSDDFPYAIAGNKFYIHDDAYVMIESDGTVANTKIIDLRSIGLSFPKRIFGYQDNVYIQTGQGLYQYEDTSPPILITDEGVSQTKVWSDRLFLFHENSVSTYSSSEGLRTAADNYEYQDFIFKKENIYHIENYPYQFAHQVDTIVLSRWDVSEMEPMLLDTAELYYGNVHLQNNFLRFSDEIQGRFFYSSIHPEYGQELWLTDGTSAGTRFVIDINNETESANISRMRSLGSKLFININPQTHYDTPSEGNGIFIYDDLASDTYELHTRECHMAPAGDKMILVEDFIFGEEEGVYVSDGSPGNLDLLTKIDGPRRVFSYESLAIIDGNTLWRTDGTETGTYELADVRIEDNYEDQTRRYGTHKDILYFNGMDGESGDLWRTDGTVSGTYKVKDFDDTNERLLDHFTSFNDTLYFVHRNKLGYSDGTENGTTLTDEYVTFVYARDSLLYTYSNDGFTSYNSQSGERVEIDNIRVAQECFPVGDKLIVHHGNSLSRRLSVIDSSGETSTLLIELNDDFIGRVYQDRLYFSHNDGITGEELWVTDGTVEGTYLVDDYNPGARRFIPDHFAEVNRKLCFSGYTLDLDHELHFLDHFFFPNFSGIVYHDENENGLRESGEIVVPQIRVELDQSGKTAYSNDDGRFGFEVEESDSLTLNVYGISCWEPVEPKQTVDISNIGTRNVEVDIALKKVINPDLQRDLEFTSTRPRCNREGKIWISLGREAICEPQKGKVLVELDTLVQVIDTSGQFQYEEGKLVFAYDSLEVQGNFQIEFDILFPDETFTREEINHTATGFIFVDGEYIENSQVHYAEILGCSFDPNDKQVSPAREEDTESNYTQFDETLYYKIRFQNTGNDTAYNVRIADQLSPQLDHSTIQMLGASHPYFMELKRDGEINFYFQNIYLPDSTTNEPASHGFVSFSIEADETIEELDVVTNQAEIYFDLNEPIITNEVINTFVEHLDYDQDGYLFYEDCDDMNDTVYPGAEEVPGNDIDEDCDGVDSSQTIELSDATINIYPNPTEDIIRIDVQGRLDYKVSLYNMEGQLQISTDSASVLNVTSLPSGIYLIEILDLGSLEKSTQKIVIAK